MYRAKDVLLFITCFMVFSCAAISNFDDLVQLFPKDPVILKSRCDDVKKTVSSKIEQIIQMPVERCSFQMVAQALDDAIRDINLIKDSLGAMADLDSQDTIREVARKNLMDIKAFERDVIWNNKQLFVVLKSYIEHVSVTEQLNDEQRYFLQYIMQEGKRNGLFLPDEKQKEFNELMLEQEQLILQFAKNMNEDKTTLCFSQEQLRGLSPSELAAFKKDDHGNYLVGLDFASGYAVLHHACDSQVRKKMYLAWDNSAYPENYTVLNELIEVSNRIARLLGYSCYAEYALADQMAQNVTIVQNFLTKLHKSASELQRTKLDLMLQELPEVRLLMQDGKIFPWDFYYLVAQYQQKVFGVNTTKIAEYFPTEHVINEALAIYQQFLGLQFEEVPCKGLLWYDTLKCFAVYDHKHALCGYLILDLYSRPNKYAHFACVGRIVGPQFIENRISPGAVVLIMNFPHTEPALLDYYYVQTLFHELGHVMHILTSKTHLYSFVPLGNVATDFVEVPSTLFENWMSDKDIIKHVSCHYITKKPLVDDQINRLLESDKFSRAAYVLELIARSLISLQLYSDTGQDIDTIVKKNYEWVQPYMTYIKENHFPASWMHIGADKRYLSKYYCYLWSEILATDLFSAIKSTGLLNQATGQRLIERILSKGAACDPNQLLRDFLGCEPNEQAFFKKLNA